MSKWPGRLRNRYAAIRERQYLRGRKIAGFAPFPLHVYRSLLLHAFNNPKVQVPPFATSDRLSPGRASLFVRHDIDTADCIRNMALLLDVDRELGVPAGIYFRADEKEYALASHRDEIQAYRAAGLEIGLHTSCYLEADYLVAFRKETELFVRALAFRPTSFTVHGLGPYRMDVRLRFSEEICQRLGEFGYAFSDCCSHLRIYDYTIHDSHWNERERVRFIYNDFLILPPFLHEGKNYILLTHPGYWVNSG